MKKTQNGRSAALFFDREQTNQIEEICKKEERSFRWVVMKCCLTGLEEWNKTVLSQLS